MEDERADKGIIYGYFISFVGITNLILLIVKNINWL